LLYGGITAALNLNKKCDVDALIVLLFVAGSWAQIINEYWILWLAVGTSLYPAIILEQKAYSN